MYIFYKVTLIYALSCLEIKTYFLEAYICSMYVPASFRVDDLSTKIAFLKEHAFGMIVMNGTDGLPLVAHLPFVCIENENEVVLEMHLARFNDLTPFLKNGSVVKCCVLGAHGYVSSAVYGHVNVPTYNYQSVHVHGTVTLLSKEELTRHLEMVVENFEQSRAVPLNFNGFPGEMIAALSNEIIGIRLTAFRIDGAFKLSQNRNEADLNRIIDELNSGSIGQQQLAAVMQKMSQE